VSIIFSARSLLPELGSDPVAAVRAGLPTTALEHLQSHLQVSDARLAPILGVSPAPSVGGARPSCSPPTSRTASPFRSTINADLSMPATCRNVLDRWQ
jgi:hypothetical protein